MALDGKEFKDDCDHLDTSGVELLEGGKEYLCKGRVHSSCPKNCDLYVKETVIEILKK